jgi:release factor glutamine methyltransferase
MSEAWTILRVLDWTRNFFESKGIESARLDAEVLIAHVLKLQRVMLYAHFDRPLNAAELAGIRALVKRRANHEPVAYLVESREFWSIDLDVDPSVLVPRPDTEVLVEVCLKRIQNRAAPKIADVGTGSGCVALALAQDRKDASIDAFEVSAAAREIAQRNVVRHEASHQIDVIESDLLGGHCAASGLYDLIVANLPYIPTDELEKLSPEVKDHEPHLALDGGDDGLDLIRRLIETSGNHLKSGGVIALEAGFDQLDTLENLMDASGFGAIEITKDYAGHPRVCSGIWP